MFRSGKRVKWPGIFFIYILVLLVYYQEKGEGRFFFLSKKWVDSNQYYRS
jgi:hypothetical protein